MKSHLIKITNWSIVGGTAHIPPENIGARLSGMVIDHPNFVSGAHTTSSRIIGAFQRVVITASGSSYLLLDIDPEYKEFLEENKIEYDPDFPIHIKTRDKECLF